MPTRTILQAWPKGVAISALCLLLTACGTAPEQSETGTAGRWGGRPIGSSPAPMPAIRQAILSSAIREWEFFGRQTVILRSTEESIPHVGAWEDDGGIYSSRVNAYWRAVGKPGLDGMDCQSPWSAAFISWVMKGAGVPEGQFPPAIAHWVYLARSIEAASEPGRWFVPRRVMDYSPKPGDLVCASRGASRSSVRDGDISASQLQGLSSHCDLVVSRSGRTLDVIGGNVRNSVSRTTLELDGQGRLQILPRRPWFIILENRL